MSTNNVHTMISRRIAYWLLNETPRDCGKEITGHLRRTAKVLEPHNNVAVLKLICISWITTHRFHTAPARKLNAACSSVVKVKTTFDTT